MILLTLLATLAAQPAASPSPDPVDVVIELLRLEKLRTSEAAALSDLRSTLAQRAAPTGLPAAPPPAGYRRRCHEGADSTACTAVPERVGETGQHGYCGDTFGGRICYTDNGSEPRVSAGRCANPCRRLPREGIQALYPEPRLSEEEKAAVLAALETDPRLRDQGALQETVRVLLASARSPRRAHPGPANTMAFTPDGSVLITSSTEGERTVLWSVATRAPLGAIAGCGAYTLVVMPDGGSALASCGREVKLWGLPEGTLRATVGVFSSAVIDLAVDKAGRTLAGAAHGTVTVWTVPGPRPLATFRTGDASALTPAVALTPDGRTLVSAGLGQPLQLWPVGAGTRPVTLDTAEPTDVIDLAVSPDGGTLAAGYGNGMVRLWSLAQRRETARRREHGFAVGALAFSADGRWLVSGSSDHSVKVWALPEGTVRHTLRGHANEVYAVAVSSAGLIASGDRDGVVRLWDLATGAEKGVLVDPAVR